MHYIFFIRQIETVLDYSHRFARRTTCLYREQKPRILFETSCRCEFLDGICLSKCRRYIGVWSATLRQLVCWMLCRNSTRVSIQNALGNEFIGRRGFLECDLESAVFFIHTASAFNHYKDDVWYAWFFHQSAFSLINQIGEGYDHHWSRVVANWDQFLGTKISHKKS